MTDTSTRTHEHAHEPRYMPRRLSATAAAKLLAAHGIASTIAPDGLIRYDPAAKSAISGRPARELIIIATQAIRRARREAMDAAAAAKRARDKARRKARRARHASD